MIGSLSAVLFAALTTGGAALAADQFEFWPELNAYIGMNGRTRLYLDAAYAKGKESFNQTLDMAAYVDVSLKPILRPALRQEDWARNRYLWTRVGYDHVYKAEGRVRSPSEDRGILSIYGKGELLREIWLEGRGRADLRWIRGEYSTRYRFRVEATREFTLLQHPVRPYFSVEWFYDTRYNDWARTLYQGGPEVTVNKRTHFVVYLARQENHHPRAEALNALGVVAKFYY